jgi:hypothetical protein
MTVAGELVHEVQMRSVEVNKGLMPWMFARPSGHYIPGHLPEGVVEPEAQWEADLSGGDSLGGGAAKPAFETFGLDEPAAGAFEASRFPDLDTATTQSILDDIGEL